MGRDRAFRAGLGAAIVLAVAAGAAALWPRWFPGPLAAARRAYERGDWKTAADASRSALKSDSTAAAGLEASRLYARALARLGHDRAAGAIYRGRLARAALDPEDLFLLGLLSARAGDSARALALWEQAGRAGRASPELLDNVARLAFEVGRVDRALEAARGLARRPGWEARGQFLLAHIQEELDNPEGAVAAARAALERDPAARGAWLSPADHRKLLARNLLRLDRAAEARNHLEIVLAARAEDLEAHWLLGRAHLRERQPREAEAELARSRAYRAENRLAPEPAPYVGSAACAPCHRDQHQAHQHTRHARSFHRGAELLKLPIPERPLADPDDPGATHVIERKDRHVEVATHRDDKIFSLVVAYAFGTPDRYVTMIGRDAEGTCRAARLSYYREPGGAGWDITSGDVGRTGATDDVRGQWIDVRDGVARCLYCHVTRPRDFRGPPFEAGAGPEAADAGIGCERCHGPGGNHIIAVEENFEDPAIVNVAGAPAATIDAQCVECHTVGRRDQIEKAPDDPKYVRSPGTTFPMSRCFTESDGRMSCLTCHDPHREAERSAAYYERKCLACHSRPGPPKAPTTTATSAATPARGATCPIDPSRNCLDCHMPRVPAPELHMVLTDHYIRVRHK